MWCAILYRSLQYLSMAITINVVWCSLLIFTEHKEGKSVGIYLMLRYGYDTIRFLSLFLSFLHTYTLFHTFQWMLNFLYFIPLDFYGEYAGFCIFMAVLRELKYKRYSNDDNDQPKMTEKLPSHLNVRRFFVENQLNLQKRLEQKKNTRLQ